MHVVSRYKEENKPIATRPGTLGVGAPIDLGIGITQFDCDVTFQFILELDSMDTGDSLHKSGFSVSDMADGTNVDCRLSTNNLKGISFIDMNM